MPRCLTEGLIWEVQIKSRRLLCCCRCFKALHSLAGTEIACLPRGWPNPHTFWRLEEFRRERKEYRPRRPSSEVSTSFGWGNSSRGTQKQMSTRRTAGRAAGNPTLCSRVKAGSSSCQLMSRSSTCRSRPTWTMAKRIDGICNWKQRVQKMLWKTELFSWFRRERAHNHEWRSSQVRALFSAWDTRTLTDPGVER